MKHFAIIPARAGSKSIPNKNIQRLGTKTLVQWAIDIASRIKFFNQVIVSTDIPYLLDSIPLEGRVIATQRQAILSSDSAEMCDVVLDVIDTQTIGDDDYFWLLQPTSPFREESDFSAILEIIENKRAKSIISVADVGGDHPNRMYTIKQGELFPLRYTSFKNKQNLMRIFIRNGSFYVGQCGPFRMNKTFYLKPCLAYVMSERRSVNIDGPDDLLWAQTLVGLK